jgi:hypothetical protein
MDFSRLSLHCQPHLSHPEAAGVLKIPNILENPQLAADN